MPRNKRMQLWGRNEDDDDLVREVLRGEKTATVDLAHQYNEAIGDYDDGGFEAGDLVDLCDLRERLRARIRITEVQTVRFGDIPRRLWQAEVCRSADHFRQAHRECWPDEELTDDTELVATHFELVEILRP